MSALLFLLGVFIFVYIVSFCASVSMFDFFFVPLTGTGAWRPLERGVWNPVPPRTDDLRGDAQ